MANYNFYFQQVDKSGTASTARDLETYFPGAKYISCTGLENIGKAKDIYSEDYAESNGLCGNLSASRSAAGSFYDVLIHWLSGCEK